MFLVSWHRKENGFEQKQNIAFFLSMCCAFNSCTKAEYQTFYISNISERGDMQTTLDIQFGYR
jgi:hypothetical protein